MESKTPVQKEEANRDNAIAPLASLSSPAIYPKMDYHIHQKEIETKDFEKSIDQLHEQIKRKIFDKSLYQQQIGFRLYHQGMRQFATLFEVLQNETTSYPEEFSTSFYPVETLIAQCVLECLTDVRKQNQDISYIQSLLRSNRVVVPVQGGTQRSSVSLHRLHVILQDNFPDSYLCSLLNILLIGFSNTETKTIDF